eukprot:scaffold155410_cov19-Tisochrysis_lutea.AAC.2
MVVSTPPSSAALDVLADATILEVAISALEKAGTKEVGKLNRNKADAADSAVMSTDLSTTKVVNGREWRPDTLLEALTVI